MKLSLRRMQYIRIEPAICAYVSGFSGCFWKKRVANFFKRQHVFAEHSDKEKRNAEDGSSSLLSEFHESFASLSRSQVHE